jgi:hypothetical protein
VCDYHHKNNDNHTIIDVILMNEFIPREAKEYISILNEEQINKVLNVGTSSTNKKRRKKS